jgi:hypothetical protein
MNMPVNPPLLIRTVNEYRWKDAILYMIKENANYFIVDKTPNWKHTLERDLKNKLYAFQNTYRNNILIYSEYIKLV